MKPRIIFLVILFSLISLGPSKSEIIKPKKFEYQGAGVVQFSDGSLGAQLNFKVEKPVYTSERTESEEQELNEYLWAVCLLHMPRVMEEARQLGDTRKFTHGIISVSWQKITIGNLFFTEVGWRSVYKLDDDKCGKKI